MKKRNNTFGARRMSTFNEPKKVYLISKLDNPVNLPYNGETLIIPPRSKRKRVDPRKLGKLPKGIFTKNA